MRHDAAESSQRMAINIRRPLLIDIHNPVVPPLIVVRYSPVVGAVGDEWVLLPVVIAVWTIGQEIQRLSVGVGGKCVGEAAVGVLVALFAPELRRAGIFKEDTVLGGYVDVIGGVLVGSCGLLEHGGNINSKC